MLYPYISPASVAASRCWARCRRDAGLAGPAGGGRWAGCDSRERCERAYGYAPRRSGAHRMAVRLRHKQYGAGGRTGTIRCVSLSSPLRLPIFGSALAVRTSRRLTGRFVYAVRRRSSPVKSCALFLFALSQQQHHLIVYKAQVIVA